MDLLDALASSDPAPGAGAAAALSAASAAALVAMAARSSRRMEGSGSIVDEAEELRRRATALIDEDGQRYREVLARERGRDEDPEGFVAAVAAANEPPAAVVAVADRVSELGLVLAADGNPRLRGDATAAALLAQGAASAATFLIELNTTSAGLDATLLRQSRECVAAIRARIAACEVAP